MKCLICFTDCDQVVSWRSLGNRQQLGYCADCEPKLKKLTGLVCPDCGRSMLAGEVCHDCRERKGKSLSYNRSLYHYDEACKALLASVSYTHLTLPTTPYV